MKTKLFKCEVWRWFDRINGNSYFSLKVTRISSGSIVFTCGMSYGYGDHPFDQAVAELRSRFKLKRIHADRYSQWLDRVDYGHGKKRDLPFKDCGFYL